MQFAATCPPPLHRKQTGGDFLGLGALFDLGTLFDLAREAGFFFVGAALAALTFVGAAACALFS